MDEPVLILADPRRSKRVKHVKRWITDPVKGILLYCEGDRVLGSVNKSDDTVTWHAVPTHEDLDRSEWLDDESAKTWLEREVG